MVRSLRLIGELLYPLCDLQPSEILLAKLSCIIPYQDFSLGHSCIAIMLFAMHRVVARDSVQRYNCSAVA